MSKFDEFLEKKVADAIYLGDKSTEHVRSVSKYSIAIVIIFGVVFAGSIYGISNARTNSGSGVAWFASIISGIIFVASLWSLGEVLYELIKRRGR